MQVNLSEEERTIVRTALQSYLSDLREEITKTEKHHWLQALHTEEEVIKRVIERLD